eukprot:5929204-Amphidinium_carterae.1
MLPSTIAPQVAYVLDPSLWMQPSALAPPLNLRALVRSCMLMVVLMHTNLAKVATATGNTMAIATWTSMMRSMSLSPNWSRPAGPPSLDHLFHLNTRLKRLHVGTTPMPLQISLTAQTVCCFAVCASASSNACVLSAPQTPRVLVT